jgi:antitoxin MazE
MLKTLTPIGNSYGMIIDRPIMELLGIGPETRLKVTVHDGGLLLQPITETNEHRARVRKAAARMAKIHRKALKELAD